MWKQYFLYLKHNGWLIAALIFSVCVLGEVFSRLLTPSLHDRWLIDPNFSRRTFIQRYQCHPDSLFRDPSPTLYPQQISILGVGSSIMFGTGIAKKEDTYLYQTAAQLNSQYQSPLYRVINLARPHKNLQEIYHSLVTHYPEYPTQIVLIDFPIEAIRMFPSQAPASAFSIFRHTSGNPVLRHSYFFHLLYDTVDTFSQSFFVHRSYTSNIASLYLEESQSWKNLIHVLHNIHAYSTQQNFYTLFIIIPVFSHFDNYHFQDIHLQIQSLFSKERINYIDTLGDLQKIRAEDYWVNSYLRLPNEDAHTQIAQTIQSLLTSRIRLAPAVDEP